MLPYDDPGPIRALPVYADNELGLSSTWIRGLEAGLLAILWSEYADGNAYFIEGKTIK